LSEDWPKLYLQSLKDGTYEALFGKLADDEFIAAVNASMPRTVKEMEPLFAAIAHGAAAGLHDEAFEEVYWPRIRQDDLDYLSSRLGAVAADLSTLANFFADDWSKPAAGLSDKNKARVLGLASFRLSAIGRLTDALGPAQAALSMQKFQRDLKNAASTSRILAGVHMSLGALDKAADAAEAGLQLAGTSGGGGAVMRCRIAKGVVLHNRGALDAAREQFERVSKWPHVHLTDGFGTAHYDVLLSRGQPQEAYRRINPQQADEAPVNDRLTTHGLNLLILGRTEQMLRMPSALPHIEAAVGALREGGDGTRLPHGLLTRASQYRMSGALPLATEDLREILEIARPSGMRLHLADHALESARLAIAAGALPEARGAASRAAALITETGYDRRLPDLAIVSAAIEIVAGKKRRARDHLLAAAPYLSAGWESHRGNFRALNAALGESDSVPEPELSPWLADEPLWTDPLFTTLRPKPGWFERLFRSRPQEHAAPQAA
jgi:tetratricopeptide (TPR) repeat protein